MNTKKYNERLKQLVWDCNYKHASSDIVLERAINYGGIDFIDEVIKRYGEDKFLDILVNRRALNKQAVSYWCIKYNIDIKQTATFKTPAFWSPF